MTVITAEEGTTLDSVWKRSPDEFDPQLKLARRSGRGHDLASVLD
jgi:hypothetical protein